MFLIYNLLSLLSLAAYLPWLLLKKGPENRFIYLSERLGITKYAHSDIWIHAVSVGEVTACIPFLKELRRSMPNTRIAFSTTTYTGQAVARDKFPEADRIMYMPWDTGICIKRAVKTLKPRIFITIETEIWPLLLKTLKNKGAKTIILNGRLSEKSFRGYKRIRSFMKTVLSNVDFLYMQEKDDADRIISLGAGPEKVTVMGNFKFDIKAKNTPLSSNWLNALNGKVIVAGSTHRGEEDIILDAYNEAKNVLDNIKLILAPRHPERFGEVEDIMKTKNIEYIRRSEIDQGSGVSSQGSFATDNGQKSSDRLLPDIILLDTIGELSQVYSRADISFVGGSLLPFGGHNILEPAVWGKPVIFGPHMENFPFSADFLDNQAALLVRDSKELSDTIKDLLKNTEKAAQIGSKAKSIVNGRTGAVEKAVGLVRSILGPS